MPSGLALSSTGKITGKTSAGFYSAAVTATSTVGKPQTVTANIMIDIWYHPTLQLSQSSFSVVTNQVFTVNFATDYKAAQCNIYGLEGTSGARVNSTGTQFSFVFSNPGFYVIEVVFFDNKNTSMSAIIYVLVKLPGAIVHIPQMVTVLSMILMFVPVIGQAAALSAMTGVSVGLGATMALNITGFALSTAAPPPANTAITIAFMLTALIPV
jgi:hypothetical protein